MRLTLLLLFVAQTLGSGPSRTVTPDDSTAIEQVAPKSPEPLSQVEQLRVENLKLERIIVDRAVSDWRAKALKLKADLEAQRKGFTWNPDDDTWTPVPVKDSK